MNQCRIKNIKNQRGSSCGSKSLSFTLYFLTFHNWIWKLLNWFGLLHCCLIDLDPSYLFRILTRICQRLIDKTVKQETNSTRAHFCQSFPNFHAWWDGIPDLEKKVAIDRCKALSLCNFRLLPLSFQACAHRETRRWRSWMPLKTSSRSKTSDFYRSTVIFCSFVSNLSEALL